MRAPAVGLLASASHDAPTAIYRGHDPVWRESYDVDDPRAKVATTFWEITQDAFRFFRELKKAVIKLAGLKREPGKPLPITRNDIAVLDAVVACMDFKTGECHPCLDTIARICLLSRATVIRSLDALRRFGIIAWVRRTEKTGNAPGEGPQRKQTSNSYFITLDRLPIEILRTLRQKLGDALKEKVSQVRRGSGPVPGKIARGIEALTKGLASKLGAGTGREAAQRRALASMTDEQRTAHIYRDDPEALAEHTRMRDCQSASRNVRMYPSLRTKRKAE